MLDYVRGSAEGAGLPQTSHEAVPNKGFGRLTLRAVFLSQPPAGCVSDAESGR